MKRIAEWYKQRTMVQRSLVAGALLLSLSVPALALAQEATGTPAASDDTATVTPDGALGMRLERGGMMGGLMERFQEFGGPGGGRGARGGGRHGGSDGGFGGGMMGGGMRMMIPPSGTVSAVSADEITVELAGPGEMAGFNREWVSVEVTVQVDEDTLVFANDLSALEVADIEVGAEVAISPRFEWGVPTAQLIYVGTRDELAAQTFSGRLESVDGDVLQLELRQGRGEKALASDDAADAEAADESAEPETLTPETLTVVADADTIWIDAGTLGRPEELTTGIHLHVLGVQGEDGEVQAVLITAGGPLRGH